MEIPTLPPGVLSKVDNKGDGDMHYLTRGRGPGSAWGFRIKTPPSLVGAADPDTGKPFPREIKRGLGTRRLAEARRKRDILLGRIRELEGAAKGNKWGPEWSTERAKALREEIDARERMADDQGGIVRANRLEPASA